MPLRKPLFLAGFLLSLLFAAGDAHADNPWDARQRERASEASRAGRSARGIVPLLQLWRDWDWASPQATVEALERLSRDRRLTPARRAYASALLARARLRTGDPAASRQMIEELGYVTSWHVIGPFDNEGKQGFTREDPPETTRMEPWEAGARYPGKERQVGWRPYPEISQYGYVDFDAVMRPTSNVCGYAETFVHSERARPLGLFLGNGGAAKMWWNGELVLTDETYRQPDPDRHVAVVAAHQGYNRLLVKLCVSETTWGFFLRVADPQGTPVTGITADGTAAHEVAAPASNARLPRAPVTDLAALERAAEGERASAQALEDLARYLAYTGSDDPDERRAKQIAARAAERQPTVERLVLASTLADERGEVQRFARRAIELAPSDPEALLLHARVLASGPDPVEALPVLDRLPPNGIYALGGALLRAGIQRGLEFDEHAMRIVDDAAARAEGSHGYIVQRTIAAESAGRADRVIELRRAAVEARHDDTSSRRALIADALRRGDGETVRREMALLDELLPGSAQHGLYASAIYEGLGDEEGALEALGRARAVAPEDATLAAAQGRLLLRLDRRDAAAGSLREALALRPQDASVRELLESIEPERRRDEAYAASSEDLLARRVERSGFPVTVLQDLTVNTVFENGLGSSFTQTAVQIHDDEGARQWRTHSIQYDPDTQRVEIREARVYRRDGRVLEATETFEQQLGEPWYRIYYDTRALVVLFPTLEPGDTVEIRYRVDDIAHRNLFADYYGDLHFLQGFTPIARMDYVLITPKSRELFFNEPALRGLRHRRLERGDTRIDRWVAEDVPAIRSEEGMPGLTQIAPHLHVSTYGTWEDVGRWWWGLIQDQLQADDHLRQVVRELVADAPDLRTKVQRIQNWVVRNTRYVGLEFGIHGYKPYRVPLVVQRGFGDCKDKASLLYVMFREAGIDARIVLVRTRRNGDIDERPASLAVFDHAIAYVPELDLYIDGTAEHSGTTELPPMDQGVMVLVVGPEDARLARTPVLPPDRNLRARTMDVQLAADGAAEIDVTERIVGAEASHYRSVYQSTGTRADRYERALRNQFPGLVLEEQEMRNLDDLEAPVEIEYSARVPQIAQRDGERLRIAPSVVHDLLRSLARRPERRYPLDVGGTSAYTEERTVRVPRGFRAATLPSGGVAESEFGALRLTVEGDGQTVRSRTELEIREDLVSPQKYRAFREWVEEADTLLRQQIVLAPEGDR